MSPKAIRYLIAYLALPRASGHRWRRRKVRGAATSRGRREPWFLIAASFAVAGVAVALATDSGDLASFTHRDLMVT